MPANTVEAVLKSRYEDGVATGVENTRALMEQGFAAMKDASAGLADGVQTAFNSAVGSLESWRTSLSKAADDSDSSFKKMGLGAAAVGIAFAEVFLRGAKAAADFVIDIMKESSEVAEARINFEALTKAQGVNADQMLTKLKGATEGQIGQLTLLRNANKVLTGDLPITAEQYERLTESVFRLSKSAGTDAVAAQDALTTALLRGVSRGLGPAIGLHLQVKDAVAAMAEEMDASAASMPDHAKLQAFYNDLLEKTDQAVAKLPPKFLTLDEVLTAAHNTWHDVLDDYGTAITRSGVMQELFQRVSESMLGMNDSMDKQRDTALKVNEALISMLRGFANLVQALAYVSYAWDAVVGVIEAGFFLIVGAAVDIGHAINSILIAIMEGLSMLPSAAGRAFQPMLDWLKKAQNGLELYRSAATDALTHSFDGFGDSAKKLGGFADSTSKLADDMEKLKGTVLDGADGVTKHAAAAEKAAADTKALTEQLAKYREMLFSLNQAVATPEQKLMNDLTKQVEEIGKLDKISADQRNDLYAAAWAKYDAEEAKRLDDENAKQKAAADREYAQKQQQQAKILELDTQFSLAAADEAQKAAIKREQDIRKIAEVVGLTTAEGKRLLLMVERAYDAEMDKLQAARIQKQQEEAKKETEQAIAAANTIVKAVEAAAKGTIPESSALTALKNMPQVLDTLKKKLAELNAQPMVTDAQITEIEKLKTAIDNLNKLNLTPLQQAFDQMKQHIQSASTQALTSFGNMLGGMLQGQSVTGAKILAEGEKMVGGLLSQMGTTLIQTGVAAIAASLTGMPGPWSYAGGLEAIAGGIAMTALGSALGGAGGSSAGGSAAAPSGSSSSQTNANPQILSVGMPNGAQPAQGNQQTQHLVTLQVQSNDAHIVKVVQSNIATNGALRVAVKTA